MIPAILDELDGVVDIADVVILVATGTHRANTDAELREMFGDAVVDAVTIVNHDAREQSEMAWVGRLGRDVPVWLNRRWLDADVRITTGFVEPHFFAGFSGGPKMVAPGSPVWTRSSCSTTRRGSATVGRRGGSPTATRSTTTSGRSRPRPASPSRSTWCSTATSGSSAAFAGDLAPMHEAAVGRARSIAMRPVAHRFDVVLTTGSGYPLDQNLYQAVKGMSAAYQIVRRGGTILCAAECRDGFPDHGSYRVELTRGLSPARCWPTSSSGRRRSRTSGSSRSKPASSPTPRS